VAKTDSIEEVATEAGSVVLRLGSQGEPPGPRTSIAGLKLGEEGAVLTGSKDPERTGFGE
jgi:hypothetical protein